MILIFDTETTNIPSKTLGLTDPNQARIMQLAWLALSNDFEEVGCFSSYIKLPDYVNIAEGAQKAHGITREMCDKYGVVAASVIPDFIERLDSASLIVAHNIWFDSQLVDIEAALAECQASTVDHWSSNKCYCTMQAMTPICKLGFRGNRPNGNKFKWPKLEEAHLHCFGEKFDKAHDALADVRATSRVLKWLVENKHLCLPTQ